ncbi:helix-turn-helix domain-containing protein [Candidatus Saccharibacteria bacterium oral taxon 488]|jgi:subunit S of type I restriction-modification system|nr:helix-turn-helix domain-containing protein [Candidatus Saccharibacteria bacterium oral taxon 488]QHU92890.1 helix-turn-helix domain-containing protein [Candidatus Saccharibacteria bacterium oral taxon 488]QJU07406.1 helix-turn-helix transcriptional regulator [Candidatus Saccharibacteria bacterium oral taxon 488]
MAVPRVRRLFGKRVRELRKKSGFSQEQLADKAGLHRTYIGAIERGEQNISVDNIDRIAKALKVSIPTLFT